MCQAAPQALYVVTNREDLSTGGGLSCFRLYYQIDRRNKRHQMPRRSLCLPPDSAGGVLSRASPLRARLQPGRDIWLVGADPHSW